jgi:hypothetical protein
MLKIPQSARPQLDGDDVLSVGTEYFRIERAAEILGCAAFDLLHLGAIGKAEITAPVVSPGSFEWPEGSEGMCFPEINGRVRVSFSAADRVILSTVDLAKIEAVGWTIPQFFYAPTAARRVLEEAMFFRGACSEVNDGNSGERDGPYTDAWLALGGGLNATLDTLMESLREIGLNSRWNPAGANVIVQNAQGDLEDISDYCPPDYSPDVVTKISHLFMSKAELKRLKSDLPQDEVAAVRGKRDQHLSDVKNIGHFERHALVHERMYRAAVYCLWKLVSSKPTSDDLVKQIDTVLQAEWPTETALSLDRMKAYLTRTVAGNMSNPK